jgi:glucose dehydrogenase
LRIVCYYQYTPNDVYDVDGTDEHVLADLPIERHRGEVASKADAA